MTDDPYADFKSPSGNLTIVLRQLADECLNAEALVEQKEAELAEAKAAYKEIVEKRIPEATDGLDGKFDLGDGRTLELKEDIRASIAGEKRVPAIQWLDNNGYGHIVKRQLVFEFSKEDQKKFEKFRKAIESLNIPVVMKEQYNVHPQTLKSWVKEQLGEGVSLPTDTFGIYRQRVAKVKE